MDYPTTTKMVMDMILPTMVVTTVTMKMLNSIQVRVKFGMTALIKTVMDYLTTTKMETDRTALYLVEKIATTNPWLYMVVHPKHITMASIKIVMA